jgi:hypothetical protein
MQDKDTIKSTFNQLFEPIFSDTFTKKLTELGVDKYVKKLTTIQLIELIAHAQIKQQGNLRDIANNFNDEEFRLAIDLESISASQISRRLRDLEPEVLKSLFKLAVNKLGCEIGFDNLIKETGRIHLIDSTTIGLCLSKYPWAIFRKTKSGVKVHLRLRFCQGTVIPDKAMITNAKTADKRQMSELVIEDPDSLNIFDRGYLDYKLFDQYCDNNTRFVTRLKDNAIIEVVKELPVSPNSPVLKDQIVYLGDGRKKMRNPLRLLEVIDSQGRRIVIITNNFKLEPQAIGDLYRNRWQIELFFKWIKQHFTVKHFYGTSQPAVENQLYIALETYCLLLLLKLKTGYRKTLLDLTRILKVSLYKPFTAFVQMLHRKPVRSSKGRRRIDNERIYQMVERQVMDAYDLSQYYDVTYDPINL